MKAPSGPLLPVALLALASLTGCHDEPLAPVPGVAAAIRLVEGGNQSGVVGQELPSPLLVEVTDAQGNPVANQILNFRVISGGGSVFAGTGLTNAAGRAQERWTLGTNAKEPQLLEARAVANATGAPLVFAAFSATALPDAPASMLIASGDFQTGMAGSALAGPLVVLLADKFDNPVPGIDVTWAIDDGGGALDASTTSTDASGQASNRWRLGPAALSQHVLAESAPLSVRFSTAAVGGIPASIAKAGGDTQIAMPGTAVALPPVVSVSDVLGNPVPGVSVQFAVTSGGGAILASSATTDASGRASCGAWTLGSTPGSNELTASVQGLGSALFSASAVLPTTVRIAGGDGQWALPGTDVPVAPTVIVTSGGPGISGVPVQFAVTSGGGSARTFIATTNANGQASCGAWTLGSSNGINGLSAAVLGLPAVNFVAYAGRQSPTIGVSAGIEGQRPGATVFVGDSFVPYAQVSSTNPIASVTGSIGGSSVAFVFSPVTVCTARFGCSSISAWNGTLSAVGLFGPATIQVTATDSFGNQTDAFVQVVVDRLPVVTVSLPQFEWLARPTIDVAATCADDGPAGCASLTVLAGGAGETDCIGGAVGPWVSTTAVAQGSATVTQTIDLSAFDRGLANLCFVGTDSTGRRAGVFRGGNVESSPKLALVAAVSGTALDVSDTRILYLDKAAPTPTLRIRDTIIGTDQLIASDSNLVYGFAYLSPAGAVHAHFDHVVNRMNAWDWRGGTTVDLGEAPEGIQVDGGYALWSRPPADLVRRDLVAGTDLVVTTDVLRSSASPQAVGDVAPNGDVVYLDGLLGEVFRYGNGTTTKISNDPAGIVNNNSFPLTDGSTIVYRKGTASGEALVVVAGGNEVTIRPGIGLGRTTILAGGWVAYDTYSAVGMDVWRHGPAGEQLVATVGVLQSPEAIGPDGTVILQDAGRRYRSVPGTGLEDIGSSLGKVIYRDGKFLALIGGSVLEITP